MAKKTVKVKILVSVGAWNAGDEVEVSPEDAAAMCTIRKKHNGYGLVDHRTAMTLEEYEKLQKLPVDAGGLTVEELKELGEKNIVVTPKEELERPFHPGFVQTKDPAEFASAKAAAGLNK